VVPEGPLEDTGGGLVAAGEGWFVMNARDALWFDRPGRQSLPLTGSNEYEAETYFSMLGMSLQVSRRARRTRSITGRPSRRTSSSCPAKRS
jgi:hypothetical protein